ncbi:hypothetical protein EMIHUDRAFT_205206 [Emiliania huxleyi CCMP1516]|uniref:Uncharacterized protein n=2 Tax=Emiliania huxleyi TaxID=2903 RepID=A0A0D3JUN1_EMIH1|nr:hypothetical protein EMIHUDRAFT_205206 [Emiliania huxleyi CCMP1516]EOD27216.1 hypothetical protein EMIHUDRAFT_205206 [Emiliania huxleyi CCMP1516]|eukprot:XP_005779645.1 hypothetical protein EMIHUDRAFT_205206 [Emiliania huxleyi CCMP1516]
MSLLALGRNGRSQAGAEASGLDSLMGWAYTTIEFTLFLWSIAVGLAYDGIAALLTSRVYRAGAGAVLLYLLGTTLIELVTSGDGGPELLFFLRMAVFVYCVGYQVRALCDYTPVRVLLLLSGGYPLFRHGAAAIAEPFRDYAAMGPYAGVLLTFSAIYLATRSMGRHVGYFMDTYIKTYVLETQIDSLLRRVRGGGAHADEPSEESVTLLHAYLRARGGLLCTLSVAVYQYGLVMIPLLVLGGLGGVGAVCPSCGSSIASCTYDTDQRCPTITIVATNASAMAGVGVVSTVTLATLIRPRYLRIFGTNALQALVAMRRRPAAGTPFSITADTSKGDIVQAISAGRICQMEAVEQLAQQLSGVEAEEEGEEKTRKLANITRSLDLLRTLKETAIPDAGGRVALASAALAFCLPAQWVAVASAAVACLTAATGRRLGASARLGVAIADSGQRNSLGLNAQARSSRTRWRESWRMQRAAMLASPRANATSLYNKLYSKIALYIALQATHIVTRRMSALCSSDVGVLIDRLDTEGGLGGLYKHLAHTKEGPLHLVPSITHCAVCALIVAIATRNSPQKSKDARTAPGPSANQ